MNSRNTSQKNIILEVLKNNRSHPTAQKLYTLVKEKDPTIGQATVYRNVKRFVEENKIYIVKTQSGVDRYDYYDGHVHFECLKCGKIIDIFDDELLTIVQKHFKNRSEKIEHYKVLLDGYCDECKKNEDKAN